MNAAPPGVSPSRWARLDSFLGDLPTEAAHRLFTIIERDLAYGGGADEAFPHAALLTTLRGVLFDREAHFPPRAVTAQRLFFTPFEDFITPSRRGRKRRARIARASLTPIWSVLRQDPACAAASRAASALDAALADSAGLPAALRAEQIAAPEAALFAAATDGFARIITHAETDDAFRRDLARRLAAATPDAAGNKATGSGAGNGALHDLAEINLMLPFVDRLKEMQEAFPRPVASLTEEDLFEARRLYAVARSDGPDAGAYVLMCLAGRLGAPWRALQIHYHLAASHDAAIADARADGALLFDMAFEDLEGMARSLERDAEGELDAADTAARLMAFAEYAEGVDAEARRARDGAASARVEACRDIAAAALERYAEQSLAAIRAAQPTRHAGGSSRLMALRPDIDRPIDLGRQGRARAGAAFLARIEELSARLGRPDTGAGPAEDARRAVRQYAGDVVMEIRAAEGAERAAAKRLMEAALALAGPLVPPSDCKALRDRASAAAVSA